MSALSSESQAKRPSLDAGSRLSMDTKRTSLDAGNRPPADTKRTSLDAGSRPSVDAKKTSMERADSDGPHQPEGAKAQKNLVFSYAGPKQLQQARMEAMQMRIKERLNATLLKSMDRYQGLETSSAVFDGAAEAAPSACASLFPKPEDEKGSLEQFSSLVVPPVVNKRGDELASTAKVVLDGRPGAFQHPSRIPPRLTNAKSVAVAYNVEEEEEEGQEDSGRRSSLRGADRGARAHQHVQHAQHAQHAQHQAADAPRGRDTAPAGRGGAGAAGGADRVKTGDEKRHASAQRARRLAEGEGTGKGGAPGGDAGGTQVSDAGGAGRGKRGGERQRRERSGGRVGGGAGGEGGRDAAGGGEGGGSPSRGRPKVDQRLVKTLRNSVAVPYVPVKVEPGIVPARGMSTTAGVIGAVKRNVVDGGAIMRPLSAQAPNTVQTRMLQSGAISPSAMERMSYVGGADMPMPAGSRPALKSKAEEAKQSVPLVMVEEIDIVQESKRKAIARMLALQHAESLNANARSRAPRTKPAASGNHRDRDQFYEPIDEEALLRQSQEAVSALLSTLHPADTERPTPDFQHQYSIASTVPSEPHEPPPTHATARMSLKEWQSQIEQLQRLVEESGDVDFGAMLCAIDATAQPPRPTPHGTARQQQQQQQQHEASLTQQLPSPRAWLGTHPQVSTEASNAHAAHAQTPFSASPTQPPSAGAMNTTQQHPSTRPHSATNTRAGSARASSPTRKPAWHLSTANLPLQYPRPKQPSQRARCTSPHSPSPPPLRTHTSSGTASPVHTRTNSGFASPVRARTDSGGSSPVHVRASNDGASPRSHGATSPSSTPNTATAPLATTPHTHASPSQYPSDRFPTQLAQGRPPPRPASAHPSLHHTHAHPRPTSASSAPYQPLHSVAGSSHTSRPNSPTRMRPTSAHPHTPWHTHSTRPNSAHSPTNPRPTSAHPRPPWRASSARPNSASVHSCFSASPSSVAPASLPQPTPSEGEGAPMYAWQLTGRPSHRHVMPQAYQQRYCGPDHRPDEWTLATDPVPPVMPWPQNPPLTSSPTSPFKRPRSSSGNSSEADFAQQKHLEPVSGEARVALVQQQQATLPSRKSANRERNPQHALARAATPPLNSTARFPLPHTPGAPSTTYPMPQPWAASSGATDPTTPASPLHAASLMQQQQQQHVQQAQGLLSSSAAATPHSPPPASHTGSPPTNSPSSHPAHSAATTTMPAAASPPIPCMPTSALGATTPRTAQHSTTQGVGGSTNKPPAFALTISRPASAARAHAGGATTPASTRSDAHAHTLPPHATEGTIQSNPEAVHTLLELPMRAQEHWAPTATAANTAFTGKNSYNKTYNSFDSTYNSTYNGRPASSRTHTQRATPPFRSRPLSATPTCVSYHNLSPRPASHLMHTLSRSPLPRPGGSTPSTPVPPHHLTRPPPSRPHSASVLRASGASGVSIGASAAAASSGGAAAAGSSASGSGGGAESSSRGGAAGASALDLGRDLSGSLYPRPRSAHALSPAGVPSKRARPPSAGRWGMGTRAEGIDA